MSSKLKTNNNYQSCEWIILHVLPGSPTQFYSTSQHVTAPIWQNLSNMSPFQISDPQDYEQNKKGDFKLLNVRVICYIAVVIRIILDVS